MADLELGNAAPRFQEAGRVTGTTNGLSKWISQFLGCEQSSSAARVRQKNSKSGFPAELDVDTAAESAAEKSPAASRIRITLFCAMPAAPSTGNRAEPAESAPPALPAWKNPHPPKGLPLYANGAIPVSLAGRIGKTRSAPLFGAFCT